MSEYVELGAIGALFLVAIREFFNYLKTKKQGSNSNFNQQIFQELQTMNTNHLNHIQGAIESGNKTLLEALHKDNMQMIQVLGEIKGLLSK